MQLPAQFPRDWRARRPPLLPTTRLGRQAVLATLVGAVLVPGWRFVPGGAALGFGLWLAGGVATIVARRRDGERSILSALTLAPLVFVVLFVVLELLVGHD